MLGVGQAIGEFVSALVTFNTLVTFGTLISLGTLITLVTFSTFDPECFC